MSKARDLINAHLYPVLATFAVIYGAIQIAPIAQQARYFNRCVEAAPQGVNTARAVMFCHGRPAMLQKTNNELKL
jgi:hypothetical protein